MKCLEIATIALRLASFDDGNVRPEPGIFIETKCNVEIGAIWRDGGLVADAGIRLPVAGIAWIRPGIEVDRRRRFTPAPQPRLNPGESKAQIFGTTTIEPVTGIRPRLSAGADMPLGRWRISPEVEFTRGGALMVSIRLPISMH